MADELTQETIDAFAAELGEDHPAVKGLRAERTARKASERTVKVLGVLGKYPNAGLSPEDVEGLALDKIEALATRLAGAQTPAPTPPAAPVAPEPETTPRPEEDAFARAARITEGIVPPVTEGKKLGRDEAWALMQRDPAEYERLRQAGRIDLGVVADDHGGSVIFRQG